MSLFYATCFPNICNPFGVTGTSFPITFVCSGQPAITGTCYLTKMNNGNSTFVSVCISLDSSTVANTANCIYVSNSAVIPTEYRPSATFNNTEAFAFSVNISGAFSLMTWTLDYTGFCRMYYTGGNNNVLYNNLSGVYCLSP